MDIRAFVASLIFGLIAALVAVMLLAADGAEAGYIQLDITIGMAPTDVPAIATTSTLPVPVLPPTAVPPTPAPMPTATQATAVAPAQSWFTTSPADWYGSEITYCHDIERVWTDEERQATKRGFEVWLETGISFREVPYSTWPNECLVKVMASFAPDSLVAGRAQHVGIFYGVQSWIWSNTAHMPHNHYVVAHEVGHVLGVGHVVGPELMNEVVQYVDRPSVENIRQARAYWFGEEE